MAKLSPDEIKKMKQARKKEETISMIKAILRMAFFAAVFGRDKKK